ncbi:MAK10-like protein [Tanacetum coccineum]
MGDANLIRTLGDYSKPSHEGYRNTIELPEGINLVPLRSDTIRLVQNGCSFHGLRSEAGVAKAISLPQDVPSTFDRRLIEHEHQVQCLMEAYMALMQATQVNKITSSCEICNGPHDTQYCMESLKQAFVEYASSRTDEAREPEKTLEDELKDLHLNLPVLKVLAHALMYNAILDKYVESLGLGKDGLGNSEPFDTLAYLGAYVNIIPLYLFKKLNIRLLEETNHVFGLADGTKSCHIGIVRDVEVHIGRLKLLTDFYVIDMKKDPDTPLLVVRGFLATANAVINYRKAKIAVEEGITRSVFGVKGIKLGQEEAPY